MKEIQTKTNTLALTKQQKRSSLIAAQQRHHNRMEETYYPKVVLLAIQLCQGWTYHAKIQMKNGGKSWHSSKVIKIFRVLALRMRKIIAQQRIKKNQKNQAMKRKRRKSQSLISRSRRQRQLLKSYQNLLVEMEVSLQAEPPRKREDLWAKHKIAKMGRPKKSQNSVVDSPTISYGLNQMAHYSLKKKRILAIFCNQKMA